MPKDRPGWGGSRVGAGRKADPTNPFSVLHGGKALKAHLTLGDDTLREPPTDLPLEQQTFWRDHAPLAIERRTLTAATTPAFKLLCELHVKKVLVGTMVDKGALGGLRIWLQIAKQVESLMARFCLAPFGKPAGEVKVEAENPWAKLG
jgi:hypothetical protein